MSEHDRGQVSGRAAEIYEEFFLPALFAEWSGRLIGAAKIRVGERVLDVACGTGVLGRAVADRVGDDGEVVGLDVNDGMLAVARRKAPGIQWKQGRAESLPFGDESFDAVLCQFGLMFFEDRAAALREMIRVARTGGRVAVWSSLDAAPGYADVVELLARLFGEEIADALRAPFVLGDRRELEGLCKESGIDRAEIRTVEGMARFPSIDAWMYTDIKGWTL